MDNAGKIEEIRFAIIVLPDPGGPIIIRLCPPAAATSTARFTYSCPLTSIKSRKDAVSCCSTAVISVGGSGGISLAEFRNATVSDRFSTGKTFNPSIIAASLAFSAGRMIFFTPLCFAAMAIGSPPCIPLMFPSSASSPNIIVLSRLLMST